MKLALTGLLLAAAAFCLALGITLPLLEMERLFVLTDRPSLIDVVAGLWNSGDPLLAAIIALASIVFPAAKIAALHVSAALAATPPDRHPAWARPLDRAVGIFTKWSMLDVMLVALAIFTARTSGLATAISQPGLWFFAGSALASAVAAWLLTPTPKQPS
ncbi:paraquat-inducible protein A [Oceaniradius stylonematis]|uniref:paraquat-inducible protein A n=1 Tax=Oceaniradius stylonematis TaxID=2184161 RepID=UPI00273E34EA|nr:paraquat-inducible protein A [Oceaniradius stylonematis]